MTGGVKGIKLSRGQCPVCGRSISGGVWGTGAGADTGKVRLRQHKALPDPGYGPRQHWCRGSRQTVERMDIP